MDEDTVKMYCEKAEGSYFFGKLVTEMTREELIAMAMMGWRAQQNQVQESQRRLDIILGRE